MEQLEKFVEDGISLYGTYLAITQKQLAQDPASITDEEFIRLISTESYYSGRLDGLEAISNYLKAFDNAQADN